MNTEITMTVLRRHPFVKGLTESDIAQLGALAREARFGHDNVLFREGEACNQFYLIVSGMVALEIVPPSGAFRLDTLTSGDELGWSSVVGQGMMFQARVLEDLHVLVFDAHELRALCERDPAFGYRLMRRMLGVVSDRLETARLLLMDYRWPVAKLAGA